MIAVQEYELEKLEQQYQKDMLDLDDWKKKAEAERTAKLRKLEEEKQRIAAELKEIDGKLNNLNREKSEKLCYELNGEINGGEYFVYIDCATGEEVNILYVVNSDAGQLVL